MKATAAILVLVAFVGCSTKPCVDGERTTHSAFGWGGSTRTSYDPCKQKCCDPGWSRGCACSKRCPCWEKHPPGQGPGAGGRG